METKSTKKEIQLIDLLTPKGHVLFVKALIAILSAEYKVTLVSSVSFCKKIDHPNNIVLPDHLFKHRGKYDLVFKQIYLLKRINKYLNKNATVLLTSFENISLSLAWRTKKNNVYAFIHNNLDKKGVSKTLFNKIKRNIKFFVFEDYIKQYLDQRLRNKVFYIPHPICQELRNPNKKVSSKSILAVNVDFTDNEIKSLEAFLREQGLKAFVKTKNVQRNTDLCIYDDYFDNYEYLLHTSEFVILNIPYDYRVSGVFYECIALNKKIVLVGNLGLFTQSVLDKYPDNVKLFKNLSSIRELQPDNHSFFKSNGNQKVLSLISKAISNKSE